MTQNRTGPPDSTFWWVDRHIRRECSLALRCCDEAYDGMKPFVDLVSRNDKHELAPDVLEFSEEKLALVNQRSRQLCGADRTAA